MNAAEVLTPMPTLVRDEFDNRDNYEIIDGVEVQLPPTTVDSAMLASRLGCCLSNHGIEKAIGEAFVNMLFPLPLPRDRTR